MLSKINDDIDIDEHLLGGPNHIPVRMSVYAVYLKKFSIFVQADEYELGGAMTLKTLYWWHHMPHILKAATAAIGFAVKFHLLPNIYDFKYAYEKKHIAIHVI